MDTPFNPNELRQWQHTHRKRQTLALLSGALLIQPTITASLCFVTLLLPLSNPTDTCLFISSLKQTNRSETNTFLSLTKTLNYSSVFSNEKSLLICLALLMLLDKIKSLLPNNNEEHTHSAGIFLITLLNTYLKNALFHASHSDSPFSLYSRIQLIFTTTLSLSLLLLFATKLVDLYWYQDDKPKQFAYDSVFTDYEQIKSKIPDDITLCPLVKQFSHTLEHLNQHIVRAMLAPDGITYDFDNLKKWFHHMKQHHQAIASPITGNTMLLASESLPLTLYPNRVIQGILDGDTHLDCPISFERFDHVITDHHGHSYNERSLQYWFFKSQQHTCPLAPDHEINNGTLRPNYTLKKYEDQQHSSAPISSTP